MKISKISVYQVDLPYSNGTYKLSGGRVYTSFDATIVCVETSCGQIGWGESTPFGPNYIAAHAMGVRAGIAEIAPMILGQDPRHTDRINDQMDQALLGHHHAKTPIDVACWDIFGKATNMPVCDLLGGRVTGGIPVISSIGADQPKKMREDVANHRAQGFMGHSVKVGTSEADGGPMVDAARIEACLADRKPGEWFLVDANGGMSPEQAIRMLSLLPDGLDFVFEAPCATWRETMSLRQRTNIPILLDELVQTEADMMQLVANDAADGVGLKISKQGGLTRTKRQRDICVAAGLVTSVQDTVGSEIAFAAILHMAQSVPRHNLRCALDTRSMVSQRVAAFNAPILDGGAIAPNDAGLGVAPDMDVLGAPIDIYEV